MPMMGAAQTQRPNIIIMNIDDMGYSDPSCFGGDYVNTTNIDRLASEGLSLTQFYTACPISSPSRVGLTTGMYPTRWGINTFLQERVNNAKNEQNDFLTDRAPSMARALKNSSYATGHFGKWQMAHGRRARCEECTVYPEQWLRRVCLYLGEPRPAHHLRQLDMAAH